jgi:hypothetical protein
LYARPANSAPIDLAIASCAFLPSLDANHLLWLQDLLTTNLLS